ncbi:MAG: hypothetical protein QF805_12245 [Pirellulaceae bacterium]|nr:hypothetical protein [Pirellulaceae bacterium]
MEINRNQYFALGVVVLLLGIQFRNVESFTLNAEVSQVIREQLKKPQDAQFVSALSPLRNSLWSIRCKPARMARRIELSPGQG